VGYSVKA